MIKEEIKDNLFKTDIVALCHGCNTKGAMHAGIANYFRLLFPEMYLAYRDLCKEKKFDAGDCFLYQHRNKETGQLEKIIGNLGTQVNPGPDAKLEHVEESLRNFFGQLTEQFQVFEVAMPRIGCGIGGLEWEGSGNVKELIDRVSTDYNIEVTIYYL